MPEQYKLRRSIMGYRAHRDLLGVLRRSCHLPATLITLLVHAILFIELDVETNTTVIYHLPVLWCTELHVRRIYQQSYYYVFIEGYCIYEPHFLTRFFIQLHRAMLRSNLNSNQGGRFWFLQQVILRVIESRYLNMSGCSLCAITQHHGRCEAKLNLQ
ncbi:hypothetical protein BJ912DRAFT_91976 [Pholiota molesta]|nr:hypothetical protein BJ912DRAFT_91976 [Pholiota molesta]